MPHIALVTGAASGIGRCVALECAKRQWKLVIVDVNEAGLKAVSDEIKAAYSVEVHPFVINLAEHDAAEKVLEFCDQKGLEVDFLANIAGIFAFGPLIDVDPKRTDLMLDLHVKTVTRMSVLFGERMRQKRFGFIMNMASMSAWMPMPGIVTYNATKAYVRSMTRALGYELKPWNVGVTAVCPGGCNTPLLPIDDKLRNMAVRFGFLMSPEKLAKKAVQATLKKKAQTIPGWMNHIFTAMIVLIPDWLVMFLMKRVKPYHRFFPSKEEQQSAES